MYRRLSLRGRTVVITGAARGVGEQLARTLSARGARLALVGLERSELASVARSLAGEADYWHADVTDASAMHRTARFIARRFGGVDAVVANAGVAAGGPFLGSDPAAWRRVVEVNLVGGANTARAFLPDLLDSRGYYLQIASLAALAPTPMMTAYCASKAGVEAFAHALQAEVAHHGVRVGVGYLSWTDTDMVRGAEREPVLRELRSRMPWPAARTYPLAPAVDRIADGIERRARHVYAQRWLRAAQFVRGGLPAAAARGGPNLMPALEALALPPGAAPAAALMGAGGAADTAARAARRPSVRSGS
ncbi:SDR family oxidoreductase [Streptomyces corynorhini]|uniref:SDR family NAD(P)-dependent oxidoreductase n=1 Tax=Streptomyces corynorhini TaxID=2282652 RepID=A0A370AZ72_9ACTN|nr:SDR family oxidoreductase [Streptomyces corynorhini]RDG34880.1 SDR family NAD(P)-dependent oxidoreductase [Streptomyces corynorhini]